MDVVYFSNVSNNTHRFVQRLPVTSHRIPLLPTEPELHVSSPYILITPTYGGGADRNAVPKQVIRFLNNEENRKLLRGVITSGNTNFGSTFGLAGKIIAEKCNVPLLHTFELLGTEADQKYVQTIIEERTKHESH